MSSSAVRFDALAPALLPSAPQSSPRRQRREITVSMLSRRWCSWCSAALGRSGGEVVEGGGAVCCAAFAGHRFFLASKLRRAAALAMPASFHGY